MELILDLFLIKNVAPFGRIQEGGAALRAEMSDNFALRSYHYYIMCWQI
jgi:hypothetical protein